MAKVTAGRDELGAFAPKFAELNDDVLFGQVWSREEQLSARDRSIVTVTALMAADSGFFFEIPLTECKKSHRRNSRRNGRDSDTCCLLRRMAKGMGSIPYGKRSLGGCR